MARREPTTLTMGGFTTVNLFDPHSKILPNQLRSCKNYDLYPNGYMKSRRGSANLQTTIQKLGDRNVLEGVTWDLGTTEYAIVQILNSGGTGSEFWWAAIDPTPTAWTQIQTLTAVNFTMANTTASDMFLSGGRLYVFHDLGNFILQWSGTAFVARPMGLAQPKITSLAAAGGAGNLTGKYTYGIELVYQVGGVDIVASTPCRKTSAGRLLSITVAAQNVQITVNSAALPASPGDYWTHVRLWRSLNQNIDNTDPLNPVDAAGLPDELYPVALVTKAALVSASYVITDSTPDTDLPGDLTSEYPILSIDRIELSPLPAALIGTYHRDRIWCSRVTSDTTQSELHYTTSAGDAYAEQYKATQVVRAESGDGQKVMKILSFEGDLIAIKEAKTGRVRDGNPDIPFEVLDHATGIKHKRLAKFIPKMGICAVTNDAGEFKIFGYDLRWSNVRNEIDLSRVIRTQTSALTPDYVSFLYINGKLLVCDGVKTIYALHVKEGMGWSVYEYALTTAQLVLTFSNGSRACVISKNAYVVEIEKEGLSTDIDTSSDSAVSIRPEYTPARFQSRDGRDVLEFCCYSIMAEASADFEAVPFVNGRSWPEPSEEVTTRLTPPASAYSVASPSLEREYRLYLEQRPIGPFQHFKITTTAPCTIHSQSLICFVDELGMGAGTFDPFANLSDADATPDWIDELVYDAIDGPRDVGAMSTLDAIDGPRDPSTMTIYDRDE